MSDFLPKVPFLRLLMPLTAGIIFQYYFFIHAWSLPILFAGLSLILISYFIPIEKEYRWRWLFGAGIYFFLFSVGVISASFRQQESTFDFSDKKETYTGTITDIPQTKPKSIAVQLNLNNSEKKIICYLQQGVRSNTLEIGDRISFSGKIQRFAHFTNPDHFNYPRYMYNKGFAGSVYLYSDNWIKIGERFPTPKIAAGKCRQKILDFYRSLGLDNDDFAVLSALTLGYKDSLSEDIKQSFRATGTAHILAVSGMHVGIIYGLLLSFFGLFVRNTSRNTFVGIAIIILLWAYAFVTGLPPSVIRATVIITLFILAAISGRKVFSYNTIFMAAFLMLIYNPFYLFDAGFQLSFAAVLSIRFLQPKLSSTVKTNKTIIKNIWSLFTLSIAAQIGTFPICLYYFGMFPTYFFITNLLVVPLVGIIFYTAVSIFFIGGIGNFLPESISSFFILIPINFLKFTVFILTSITEFFEKFPFAVIEIQKPSFLSLLFIVIIIWTITFSMIYKKTKTFIFCLSFTLLSIFLVKFDVFGMRKNILTLYPNNGNTKIEWNVGNNYFSIDSLTLNNIICLDNKNFLSVSEDKWDNKLPKNRYEIDYLHIFKNDSISLYSLTRTFIIRHIILDHSLSNKKRKEIIKECEILGIPYFDLGKNGMFRINF